MEFLSLPLSSVDQLAQTVGLLALRGTGVDGLILSEGGLAQSALLGVWLRQ